MNIPPILQAWLFVLLLHADGDVTTAKYEALNGPCVIIDELCICIQLFNSYILLVSDCVILLESFNLAF